MGNQCCCGLSPKDIRRNKRHVWIISKLLKIFQFLGNQQTIAILCESLGSLYSSLREYDKSEQMFMRAIELNQKFNYELVAHNYLGLGNTYLVQGKYDKAVDSFLKAQSYFIELNQKFNYELVAHNYQTLGYTYQIQGKYDKAVDSFLKAQSYFKEAGRDYFYKLMYQTLGSAYMSKGDLDKAEEMYLMAAKAFEELKIDVQFILELGRIYRLKGEFEKAEEVLLNSLEKVKDKYNGYFSIYLSLGKVYEGKKEKEKEKEYLQKAVDILKNGGSKEFMEKIEKRIAELN